MKIRFLSISLGLFVLGFVSCQQFREEDLELLERKTIANSWTLDASKTLYYLDNQVFGQVPTNLSLSFNGDFFFSLPEFFETTGSSISISLNYFQQRFLSPQHLVEGHNNFFRLSYSEQLDATKAYQEHPFYAELYSTPEKACSEGWKTIGSQPFHGSLAGFTARFQPRRGVCEILDGETVVAIFALRSEAGKPYGDTHILRLSNGSYYLFEKKASGQFRTIYDPDFRLEKNDQGWKLRHRYLGSYQLNDQGRLTKVTDLRGNFVELRYRKPENDASELEIVTLESSKREKLEVLQTLSGRPIYLIDQAGPIVTVAQGALAIDHRARFFRYHAANGLLEYVGKTALDPHQAFPVGALLQFGYDRFFRLSLYSSLANRLRVEQNDDFADGRFVANQTLRLRSENRVSKLVSSQGYRFGKNQLAVVDLATDDLVYLRNYGLIDQQFLPLDEKREEILDDSPKNDRKSWLSERVFLYDSFGNYQGMVDSTRSYRSFNGNALGKEFIALNEDAGFAEKKTSRLWTAALDLLKKNIWPNSARFDGAKIAEVGLMAKVEEDTSAPDPFSENPYIEQQAAEAEKNFAPAFRADDYGITDYGIGDCFYYGCYPPLIKNNPSFRKNPQNFLWPEHFSSDVGWINGIRAQLNFDRTERRILVPLNNFYVYSRLDKWSRNSSKGGPLGPRYWVYPPFYTIVEGLAYYVCAEQDKPKDPVPCRWREKNHHDFGMPDPLAALAAEGSAESTEKIDLCDPLKTALFLFAEPASFAAGAPDREEPVRLFQNKLQSYCQTNFGTSATIFYFQGSSDIGEAYQRERGKKIVFLGHGVGAHQAILGSKSYLPDLLITLDPLLREPTTGSEQKLANWLKANNFGNAIHASNLLVFQPLTHLRSLIYRELAEAGQVESAAERSFPRYKLAWYNLRATIEGAAGDKNPFMHNPQFIANRFCADDAWMRSRTDRVESARSARLDSSSAPDASGPWVLGPMDQVLQSYQLAAAKNKALFDKTGESTAAWTLLEQAARSSIAALKEEFPAARGLSSEVHCSDILTNPSIPLPSASAEKNLAWTLDDWSAFSANKYYSYPIHKTAFLRLCETHHDEFDAMLIRALRELDRQGFLRDSRGGRAISSLVFPEGKECAVPR